MKLISFAIALSLILACTCFAEPPSHDPSRMIRNVDGTYWIFTTGDGIWSMSASNSMFTDWRPDATPYNTTDYPSWIHNYVSGFRGNFWAPDVIKMGSTYFLYYSCAGDGAPAAIGLTTATNLAGPWRDQGMIVAGNNAIDPALLMDGNDLWMTWGNWQSGIDIVQLNPSTGKRLNSTKYHLVDGQVEGPALIKHDNYYYLFYQRGLCCNGVNSTYYIVVARSTRVTGPYSGERTFLPNRDGRYIGPGHIGYNEGKLTYHFYDGYDNGAAKLMITTLGWSNGWPVVGGASDDGGDGDDECQSYTATNDQHVSANRAYTQTVTSGCSSVTNYYANGSNESMGSSGTTTTTFYTQDNGQSYYVGSCPDDGTDDPYPDNDGDGYSSDVDCNDLSASIHPGATETCGDGIDQDCNGSDLSCGGGCN